MLTAPYVHSYNSNNQNKQQIQQRHIVSSNNNNNSSDQVMTMIDYTNLYIKNLDSEVTSYDLFKRFRIFGKIISARVMKDTITGKSKGYGFVSFSNMEESSEAQSRMNGELINSKNIVVTFHEHKKAVKKGNQVQQQPQHQSQQQQQGLINLNSPPTIACYPSPQSTSYNGFIPEQQQIVSNHKQTLYSNNSNNPWNESNIWMQQQQQVQQNKPMVMMQPSPVPQSQVPITPSSYSYNSHHSDSMMMHHNIAAAAASSSSASFVSQSQQQQQNNNNLSNQFQYQKLREAISLQLNDYQQKDLNDLVDLIQSLKKRELSLCLFNPTFLKQKIVEAYEAIRLFQNPSSGVTTPSLIHHTAEHQQQQTSSSNTSESNETTSQVVTAILSSSMSENQKKRAFGDIFFPFVRSTGIKHAPKITIRLLDTVPLEELAYSMYDKKELTRKAQIAYQDLYAA